MEQLNKAKSFTPTQAMRNNAKRGLALREKWNRGGLSASQAKSEGVGSGVARARDIANGNLTLDTVKRMHAFFSRHEKNFNPSKKEADGGPTAGTIAWYLWGGSAGKAWARSILRQEKLLKAVDAELNLNIEELKDKLSVTKAVNEELKQATFVVMVPDEIDAHGDVTTEEEIRKACYNFNKYSMKANLFHLVETKTFEFCESYCCPTDFILGDKLVRKGTWLATIQALDDGLWELIKSGDINGLSIGALASVETIEEDE